MRHTVRALRLVIIVLWFAVLLMPVTVALSLWEIFEARNNVAIGEPSFSVSDEDFFISVPFFINNTGFYDISELFAKIRVYNGNEEIMEFSTEPLNIPAGRMVKSSLNVSGSLADIISRDKELLTSSKDLDVSVALHFQVACILAFNIARNFTYKWGAPFSNLTINYIRINATHVSFLISFYNNASFPLSGLLKVGLFNLQNVSIGSASQVLDVASGGFYRELFEIPVSETVDEGIIRLFFADILIVERSWGSS
ncbi:MAG: hypothetical protein QXU45_02765 [Candidatus Bathyarchaeia archaeon]